MAWDNTRRNVRSLESRLDAALNQYSRLAADISAQGTSTSRNDGLAAYRSAAKPWPGNDVEEGRSRGANEATSDQAAKLEGDIERMLSELSTADERLATLLEDLPPSASHQHTLQRHREVLLDLEQDYARTRSNVKQALDRKDLLGSVKIDIANYKAQHGGDTDALLAERSRLDNSHRMLDGTLDQAYATRADLASQRSTLTDMTSRLTNTASQVPGLNNLIRLISRRRQRDRIIMGFVIGSCTVLFLMYLTR